MSPFNTYGSMTIDGTLQGVYESPGLYPGNAPAPYIYGRGAPPPTISMNAGADVGQVASGDVQLAVENPFHPVHSPVLWAVAFIIIGLVGLRHVHWRG